jgi:hypothetical protein
MDQDQLTEGEEIMNSNESPSKEKVDARAPVISKITAPPQTSTPPINLESSAVASDGINPGLVPTEILAEAVHISRFALDGLLSKAHDLHEESWRTIQSLFEDLNIRLHREFEGRLADFEKEFSKQGRNQTTALLELIDLEAESRLTARLDETLVKAKEGERQRARSLEDTIEAGRTVLGEAANIAMQQLEQQKLTHLKDFKDDVQVCFEDLKTQQVADFQSVARRTEDELSEHFNKWTNDALKSVQERLSYIEAEITEHMKKSLSTLKETAIAEVASEVEAIVARETSTHLIQAVRSRLDQLMNSLKV